MSDFKKARRISSDSAQLALRDKGWAFTKSLASEHVRDITFTALAPCALIPDPTPNPIPNPNPTEKWNLFARLVGHWSHDYLKLRAVFCL